jgi:dTDP-4-amino-4,6-dideoxygalactose transaminase
MRSINMLDLKAEYDLFRDDIREAVDQVLESQYFIGGPAIADFEAAMRSRIGAADAVAVSSGTDALLCSLMALGVGPGDEVVLPAFTFFATGGVVARLGATPVFVDVDERTFNLDPACVASALSDRTKAVIVVHLFGQCADMVALREVVGDRKVVLVEDACQAIDATDHGGAAGTLGDLACFSFYPTKNLGGFGEGGMITTNDERLGAFARQLCRHGQSDRYFHEHVGGNFRLDTMKAAILKVKLAKLSEFTDRRRRNAAAYDRSLAGSPVMTPFVRDGCKHVYHQYTITCDRRDDLVAFLRERGVGAGVYYPLGLHRQPCFAGKGGGGSLPATDRLCERVVTLPSHPMLADDDIAYVAGAIHEFFGTSMSVDAMGKAGAKASA